MTALEYFSRLDALVKLGTELYVIGGSAIALLGAKIRTTADVDVALPYSKLDVAAFGEASAKAGLPVDPAFGYQGAYIELVKPMLRGGVTLDAVRESVSRLPERFREDVMTVENLGNLERDLAVWRAVQ